MCACCTAFQHAQLCSYELDAHCLAASHADAQFICSILRYSPGLLMWVSESSIVERNQSISAAVSCSSGPTQLPADCRHVGSTLFTKEQGAPVFRFLVEVLAHDKWQAHRNIASNVGTMIAGKQPDTQLRTHQNGKLAVHIETAAVDMPNSSLQEAGPSWLMSLGKFANHLEDAALGPQQLLS